LYSDFIEVLPFPPAAVEWAVAFHPETMTVRYRYLPTLDGWRAIAIVMVVISHVRSPLFARPGWVHDVATYGRLGVDIFFAISGLLICGRLLDEAEQASIDLRAFYIRRAFRILPPYLLYVGALSLLTLAGAVTVTPVDFLVTLAFLRNYFMIGFSVYTNHFWSLAVEEHFYLLWPSTLRALGPRRSIGAALGICVAVSVWRGVLVRSPHLLAMFPHTGVLWQTDTRIDALLWGCLGALCTRRLAPFFSRWPLTLPLLLVLVVAAVGKLPLQPLVYAVGFAALVLSTVLNPRSLASRLLELSPVRWIGRLSYSLYLWQTLFFEQEFPTGVLGSFQQFPLNVVALFACATASYYLVERPLIAFGRGLAESASAPRAVVAGGAGTGAAV
jgi:peptidoglycan/LPS O-acetylase OafA/YrhL